MKFRNRTKVVLRPMDVGYYISNLLLSEGAIIDEIHDLPLTTTIRFTMKTALFKNKVSPLIAWNLSGDIDDKIAQVIESEALTQEIWQYKVMFIKQHFLADAREQLSA